MFRRMSAAAAAVVMAILCAVTALSAPAMATVTDPVCASLPVVNASVTYQECSYSNATNIWLEHLGWGWDYVNLKPHAMAVDGATGNAIVNVFSLPLPPGASTSALQPALNADGGAAAHVTNFPALQAVSQADQSGSGTITLGTVNSVLTFPLTAGRGTVGTNISGLTAGGGTLIPEAQNGPGAPWVVISAVAPGATAVQAITADGNYTLDGAGHYAVRYRVGTASATTSASATIYYDATASVGLVRETNSAAIAANTAPIAGQAMTAISTTVSTNGVALTTGGRGTELLLPTSSSTLTFAIEATATCGAAAPGDSITLTGPAVFDIPLASGVVVCETAATAAHSRGF